MYPHCWRTAFAPHRSSLDTDIWISIYVYVSPQVEAQLPVPPNVMIILPTFRFLQTRLSCTCTSLQARLDAVSWLSPTMLLNVRR